MEIFRFLKGIYSGKDNLLNHIIIFSLSGILAILFSKCCAYYFGIFYFGYPLTSGWLVDICLSFMVCVALFFFGYLYSYSNNIYKNDNSNLPNIEFTAFDSFIKMIPITLFWGAIVGILVFLGLIFFNLQKEFFESMFYFSCIFILIPFVNVIFALYSKNFSSKLALYSPLAPFKIMSKTFVPVVLLTIECIILGSMLLLVLHKLFIFSNKIPNPNIQIGLRLFVLSLGVYMLNIICYFNIYRVVQVSKNIEI